MSSSAHTDVDVPHWSAARNGAGLAAEPAVGEHDDDRVGAATNVFADVVGAHRQPVVVLHVAGQQFVADPRRR